LQNQQTEDKEGLNSIKELEVSKEAPQSGTKNKTWALRKCCSDLENDKLCLTQENDALRTERDVLKADFNEVKRRNRSEIDNSNAISEERQECQCATDELKGPEGTVKVMFEQRSSVQEAQLTWTQESETFRAAHVQLKVNFEERGELKALREDHDSLQKAQGKLVYMEGGIKNVLDEISCIQTALFTETQQRENLRLEHEELKVNFEELERERSKLKDDLNATRDERDALQKDKKKLVDSERRLKKTLDELLSIQKANLVVTLERESLKSEYSELKAYSERLEAKCNTCNDNVNVLRDTCDSLQKDKDKLSELEVRMIEMFDELSGIQDAQLTVAQEKETLWSEQKELRANCEELERDCGSLNDNVNVFKLKCDSLQKDKEKLVDLQGGMKRMLKEFSAIQKALLAVVRERDTLKSERNDLKLNFHELQRECDALKGDLQTVREEQTFVAGSTGCSECSDG
jgi:chromosome segregation ATPase